MNTTALLRVGIENTGDLVRPYMIPGAVTISEAAAPHSSLAFTFWGDAFSSSR